MAGGHSGDDDIAFYHADIGETRLLALTTASAQTPDNEGALPAGRWLVQLLDASDRAWVHFGKFVSGGTLTATTVPGRQRIVLDPNDGITYFEINIRPDYNDRIAGIMRSGTGNLFFTRISRGT